jgi:hypothetical protein
MMPSLFRQIGARKRSNGSVAGAARRARRTWKAVATSHARLAMARRAGSRRRKKKQQEARGCLPTIFPRLNFGVPLSNPLKEVTAAAAGAPNVTQRCERECGTARPGLVWSRELCRQHGAEAIATSVFRCASGSRGSGRTIAYRANLGRGILVGLEILIAADILKSVVVDPTLQGVAVLGGIVAIRTFLSISLDVEINGHWPWETTGSQAASPAHRGRLPWAAPAPAPGTFVSHGSASTPPAAGVSCGGMQHPFRRIRSD